MLRFLKGNPRLLAWLILLITTGSMAIMRSRNLPSAQLTARFESEGVVVPGLVHAKEMLEQGGRQYPTLTVDYRVEADVTPHLASSCGLAARVQGMRRHYSLVLVPGTGVELRATVDDAPEKLAESAADVALGSTWHLTVQVDESSIVATATGPDGTQHRLTADDDRLANGAIALSCEEGRSATEQVTLVPLLR